MDNNKEKAKHDMKEKSNLVSLNLYVYILLPSIVSTNEDSKILMLQSY